MAYGALHTAQYRPAAAKPERRAVTRSETFIITPPNPKKLHIHPFIAVPDSQSGATFAVSDSKYGAGFVTADFAFFASADLQSAAPFPHIPHTVFASADPHTSADLQSAAQFAASFISAAKHCGGVDYKSTSALRGLQIRYSVWEKSEFQIRYSEIQERYFEIINNNINQKKL